jgi:TolA-binding protein
MNYLKAGVIDKSIPHFINLQSKKHQYEVAHRNPMFRNDRKLQVEKALGFSPYDLQVSELFSVDFHLGEAYYKNGDFPKATKAINGYLESNRKFGNNKKISKTGISLDAQSQFEALSLLGEIYWLQARETRNKIKQKRAARSQLQLISLLDKKWKFYLSSAKNSLEELFSPKYRVYGGLYNQKLILAEVNYFLGNYDQVQKYAKDYWPKEREKVNRMELWRLMALLKINPYEPVGPFLRAIADENTKRDLKLAALVVLGNTYNERGEIDIALGKLISGKNESAEAKNKSVYLRAAIQFKEDEFDTNPYIEKISLIDAITKRIMLAREESDEDTAISLYVFLYNKFTVPEAQLLHQIAYLQRQKAREIMTSLEAPKASEIKDKEKLKKEAHDLYKLSGESFLKSLESPYDKSVAKDIYFQAGESFYEGGYYTSSYDMYEKFINSQWGDKRISEAQFKKGISALYRNRETRFEDAKMEFFANILKNQRPVESNYELPKDEEVEFDLKFLTSANTMLDQVLMSLGNVNNKDLNNYRRMAAEFQEKYKSNQIASALKLYDRIRNDLQADRRFSGNTIELPKDFKKDLERMQLKKVLSGKDKASRDIWAYKSHLELANVYYASHEYDIAKQLYENIRNDSRFTPQSDIWRRAAYSNAKVNYDKVAQSQMDPKPWHVAIGRLEDVLFLYNLPDYIAKFSAADKVLLNIFKKENAKIKFLLIKAYLANKNLKSAELHAQQLLDESESSEYILDMNLQQTSEALYGDVLYRLKKYKLALEYYRRAHDRNLEAFERPFYSLNIVDCLVGMGKKTEAINRLKRTHWEFKELYQNDNRILTDKNKISKKEWMKIIEERIKVLES